MRFIHKCGSPDFFEREKQHLFGVSDDLLDFELAAELSESREFISFLRAVFVGWR